MPLGTRLLVPGRVDREDLKTIVRALRAGFPRETIEEIASPIASLLGVDGYLQVVAGRMCFAAQNGEEPDPIGVEVLEQLAGAFGYSVNVRRDSLDLQFGGIVSTVRVVVVEIYRRHVIFDPSSKRGRA